METVNYSMHGPCKPIGRLIQYEMSLNIAARNIQDGRMKFMMNIKNLNPIQQVADILHGRDPVELPGTYKAKRYQRIAQTLQCCRYPSPAPPDKGLSLAYIGHISGYSRQQLTRLPRRWCEGGGWFSLCKASLGAALRRISTSWRSSMPFTIPFGSGRGKALRAPFKSKIMKLRGDYSSPEANSLTPSQNVSCRYSLLPLDAPSD